LFNINQYIVGTPSHCQRFICKDSLFTILNCRPENKYADILSHNNCIVYVLKGRKIWHTAHGSYDLQQGSCVFVRKGACIVEHFFDTDFCFFLFFVTDEFICEVLRSKSTPLHKSVKKNNSVITIENSAAIYGFFKSMLPYFNAAHAPDQSLLELKFRELILILADNPLNKELLCYFYSLLHAPHAVSLQMVMEDNYCFNLRQDDFAKLCYRSLSAFKRDFQQLYGISPGKWLLEKRLNHAMHLLTNTNKTVSETVFESGFENASHFSRSFKERYGMPPTAVRQMRRSA
jgi:AraC family transcriptional regulator, exoenzyme S synthesis regulatory protein ExsA